MSKFFKAVKALFPSGRAFELFTENKKYKLLQALCALPEDIREKAEKVYLDLFPYQTRFPEIWEEIFALYLTGQERGRRQAITDSMWKIIYGGQSALFLENVLRGIDDRIRVDENTPLKNPRTGNVNILSANGVPGMVCGNAKARNSFRMGDSSFEPAVLMNDVSKLYDIKDDPRFWGECFYVGGGVERNLDSRWIDRINVIEINKEWKNFIEYFILRIKPLHTTAVLYIKWTEGNDDKD
jgi:hypothetical protein